MSNKFHSNGKLLLTGEYLVLDGAKALALPTKFGQSMEVSEGKPNLISWKSLNEKGEIWFQDEIFIAESRKFNTAKSDEISERLKKIFQEAYELNPTFFSGKTGIEIISKLEFPQNWGLGSSSTLINNIAQWIEVDPYKLLEKTFGGSGYDIACAKSDSPISYQLTASDRIVQKVDFNPIFKENLFFVHLNRKQNSRQAIAHYKKQQKNQLSGEIETISQITDELIDCKKLPDFEKLLEKHEEIISSVIQIPTIKKQLFSTFRNAIKSLGGWGGDFILAVGGKNERDYFIKRGFGNILGYEEMVKNDF